MISDYEAQADDELDLKVGDMIKAIAYVSHCAIIMHVGFVFNCYHFCRWMRDGVRGRSRGKKDGFVTSL